MRKISALMILLVVIAAVVGCSKAKTAVGADATAPGAGRKIILRFKPLPAYSCTYLCRSEMRFGPMGDLADQMGNEETAKKFREGSSSTTDEEVSYRVGNITDGRIEIWIKSKVVGASGSGLFSGNENSMFHQDRERQRFYNDRYVRQEVDGLPSPIDDTIITFPEEEITVGVPFKVKEEFFGTKFMQEYVAESIETQNGREIVKLVLRVRNEDGSIIGISKSCWYELDTGILVRSESALDFNPSSPKESGMWSTVTRR
ncbi:MAG: hypothetical protein U0R49_04805 [Fimbriimonadales bacterium]